MPGCLISLCRALIACIFCASLRVTVVRFCCVCLIVGVIWATGLQQSSICTGNASLCASVARSASMWWYIASLQLATICIEPHIFAALKLVLCVASLKI